MSRLVLRSARGVLTRAVAATCLALLGAVTLSQVAVAFTAAPSASLTAGDEDHADSGVIIVGTGGLYWEDVERGTTLWRMVSEGSVASISVRSASQEMCPLNTWLAVSAGRRTLSPSSGDEEATTPEGGLDPAPVADCLPLPDPVATGMATGRWATPHDVTGWDGLTAPAVAPTSSDGTPGTLGLRLDGRGVCSTAVGPGAALALALPGGRVPRYTSSLSTLDLGDLFSCPVAVVDLGELSYEPSERQGDLKDLDAALTLLVENAPSGWRVVVAGVSGPPVDELGPQVVIDWSSDGGRVGWLTSESTRRPGIVTLADLTATALESVGAVSDDLEGSPLEVADERRMSTERTVENRRYLTELTTTVHRLRPLFVAVAVAAVTAVGCALLAVRRRTRTGRSGPGATFTPTIRRVATAVLLLVACAPAGTFVAALSRWWVSGAPVVTAIVSSVIGTTVLALVAWGASRLMPRGFWRVAGATAGVTWLVLTIDGLTDTILQQGSILGEPPTLGDRYYGFGNTAFAVYAAASLVLAGTLASFALARGRRAAAVTVVVAVGLVAAIVDGWPGFGADFGGVLALVPAFGVLVLAVGGVALTKRRALITGLVTVGAVSVVAVIDWLRPGGRTHLGLFVQRVVDGEAVGVIWDKAAGAWATVANPAGAAAAVLCIVVCVVLVGPSRARPTSLQNAYARFPLVRSVVTAVVVAAVLGGFLNDSGVVVASVVLGVAGVLLAASWCAAIWFSAPEAVAPDVDARVLRMPAVVIATGGVLLGVLLLTTAVVVPASAVVAGDVARGSQSLVVHDGDRVVVIGMSGVRWQDVSRSQTPTLWALLRDGAAAGGVTQGATGRDARCAAGGWLALSSGNAPVTGAVVNGKWACTPSWTEPDEDSEGAVVANWDALQDLQTSSGSRSRLGVLAESLAGTGACATAVGPGAALALADDSGEVERYRDLDAALADPQDAFSCQVTLVDAGSAPQAREASGPPVEDDARSTALSDIDATVRQVMADAPLGAVVMIVDVGDPTAAQPWLGVGLVDAGSRSTSRFLTASSTRWEGVVQLLDVPTTILAAVGADTPPQMAGSVIGAGGLRSSDLSRTVDELAVLTVRDHTMRGLSDALTTTPAFALLALSGLIVLLARRAPRADGVRSRWRSVVRGAVDGLALVVVSIPAGLFLMTTWLWWWVDSPAVGMWCALAASTMIVAGVGALVPRRPAYAAPAVVCAITAAVLTLDAAVGTPLHRGGPLGPAPTLGGRYYGFGIPTTVVYAMAMAVTAVGLATWLVRRGRRRFAVVAAVVVAVVTLLVDLWATSGVDISGGPVLAAGCAVVALTVAGAGVMWRVRAP